MQNCKAENGAVAGKKETSVTASRAALRGTKHHGSTSHVIAATLGAQAAKKAHRAAMANRAASGGRVLRLKKA